MHDTCKGDKHCAQAIPLWFCSRFSHDINKSIATSGCTTFTLGCCESLADLVPLQRSR